MVNTYRKCRDILVAGLSDIDGISCLYPEGAFYVFANITKAGKTSSEFADFLLEKVGGSSLSRNGFGINGEDYIRLCYAVNSEENIVECLKRIKYVEGKSYD